MHLNDKPTLRALFVTPECAPMTKTGGLGDVSASLPAALRAIGVDIKVLLPGYREVLSGLSFNKETPLEILGRQVRLLESAEFLVLDCPELYVREGGPYQDAQGADWEDNALRFAVLCKAAAQLPFDVLHCNDWPAGLVPLYGATPSILTVHNLAFQGNFDPAVVPRLELPADAMSIERGEFYGKFSFLKAGLTSASAITTVSPTYAREIQTEEFGCGMEGILRLRSGVLTGVLNGIDTRVWDPADDSHLPEKYSVESLDGKSANKAALQHRMGLAPDARVPLIGMVGRMTEQKGIDLVTGAIDKLASLAQVAILGTGQREFEAALTAAAGRHAGRVAVRIGFSEELAHLVEAGADIFLMPSRFEPCGLNQMYSQRYGTPPVARATGGLADTIVDGKTGFLFETDFLDAVRRALAAYRDPARWKEIQRAGMLRDFSWDAAARRYADLYGRLATRARAAQQR